MAPVLLSGHQHQPVRNRDYNQTYPEDILLEGMADSARVWRVYNDEADRIDAEIVDRWKATLDTLLIFVGFQCSAISSSVVMVILTGRSLFCLHCLILGAIHSKPKS